MYERFIIREDRSKGDSGTELIVLGKKITLMTDAYSNANENIREYLNEHLPPKWKDPYNR